VSVTNISNALLEAVDLIESKGEGAFSAITKVACAHNLTEDQITRVCQTYNRSQQLNTRVAKHSDSVKFAAVGGIVDPTSVINEVQSRRGRLHVSAKTAALEQLQTARSVLMPVDFTTSKVASVTPTQVVPDVDRELGLYHGYSYNQALDLLLDWNGKLGSLQMAFSG
jgi:hypothetical protein